jgi:7-cyano-7-deazaguanine synthase
MLKKITQHQFLSQLKTRKLENIDVIKLIEQSLKEQRGFVFRMPPKDSPVILLLSGGLDSVTCWGILMEEFGLHVYPLSFDRGEKRASKEQASIDYFSKYYKKQYPALFHQPLRLSLGVKDITIPIESALKDIHPEIILDKFDGNGQLLDLNISFGSFLLLPVYAKLYAEYLYHTQNLYIRNIFCSVTLSDGLMVPHQTFTSLRSIMYYLCIASGDYSWQFSSVVFEKETGLYCDKFNLVQWANDHKIPLEKTWSCYHSKKYQCGGSDCITCAVRVDAFYKAGVPDKTIYRSVADQSLLGVIKLKLRSAIRKIKNLIKSHLIIR